MTSRAIRRGLLLTSIATAAVLTTGVAFAVAGHHSHHSSAHSPKSTAPASSAPVTTTAAAVTTSTATITATPSATSTTGGVDYTSPIAVAGVYVTHEKSLDWHWDGAAGYLPALKPLSTARHWSVDLAPMQDAPSGATWLDLKAQHGMWVVTSVTPFIVPEAPRTPTACIVKVAYHQLVTADNGRPGGVQYIGSVNLTMVKQADGRWLVDSVADEGSN